MDAVRHCTYYRLQFYRLLLVDYIVIFRAVLWRPGTAFTFIVIPWSTRGLRHHPCIADMHGTYVYFVVYRASDMHGIYFHIVARHSSIRHGVYLLSGIRQLHRIRLLLVLVFLSELSLIHI